MQPLVEFERRLSDMITLNRSVKKEIKADTESLKQYLHIAFISRAELERRKSTVEALVDDYNKQQALTECAKAHPKKAGLFKDADRKECESAAEGHFLIKANHGIIDTKLSATTQDFHDGSLSNDASRADLVKKFRSLKTDDHAMVVTALKVWQNMLEGKTLEARRLAMHRDPVSVLIALLDPSKFEETLSHMSRIQIRAILKSMNNLMSGQKNKLYVFSSRALLMRDIKKIIKTCRDMMGALSKQEVRQALKVLSPAPDMKRLIENLVRDEARALLPWKLTLGQTGGSLTSIFKELGLLCLSVLCVVPIVPMLVIWMPYLMVPEEEKYQAIDPFADFIKTTFAGYTNDVTTDGFVSKMLKGAENWINFQYQLLATFTVGRMLKRTAAVTTKNFQTYAQTTLIPTLAAETEKTLRQLADAERMTPGNIEFTRKLTKGIDERVDKLQTAAEKAGTNLGTWAIGKIYGNQVANEVANGDIQIGTLLETNLKKKIQDVEALTERVIKNAAQEVNYVAARQVPHWLLTAEQKQANIRTLREAGLEGNGYEPIPQTEPRRASWNPFSR